MGISRSDFSFSQKKSVLTSNFGENFLSSENYKSPINYSIALNENAELDSLSTLSLLNKNQDYKEYETIIKEIVLPKNSWKYKVKKNETLSQIAYKFKVPVKKIISMNNITEKSVIKAGQTIYLPPEVKVSRTISIANIPIVGKFIQALSPIGNWISPVSGYNQKAIHSNNGVDISSECGQPVYSASAGIVIESSNGWNGGYGNYVKIQHDNGSATLYGHLSSRYIEQGNYVEKGTLIGAVGTSGKTTGCHLHFEVRGAGNFLLK